MKQVTDFIGRHARIRTGDLYHVKVAPRYRFTNRKQRLTPSGVGFRTACFWRVLSMYLTTFGRAR